MTILGLVMFLVALGLVILLFPVTPLTRRVIVVALIVLMVIWFLCLLGVVPGAGYFGSVRVGR